jgi:hypothetical protein
MTVAARRPLRNRSDLNLTISENAGTGERLSQARGRHAVKAGADHRRDRFEWRARYLRADVTSRHVRRERCRRVLPASTRASARSRMSSEMLPPVPKHGV